MSERISIPVQWIDNRLRELRDEIGQLRRRLSRLEAEESVLEEWRENPPGPGAKLSPAAQAARHVRPSGHRVSRWPQGDMPGPSDAVDRLVEENPGVSSKALINEALERGINSNADNKRGVLRTAVRRRLRNGDLVEDQRGGLWPKDHPRGKEVAAQQQEDDENEDLPF